MNVLKFSSGYRPFTSYWWKHWLSARTYWQPLLWSYQRITRGWSDRDVWSFDSFLTAVILGGLSRLKVTQHGIPCAFCSDNSGPLLSEDIARWDAVVDKMILGFAAAEDLMEYGEDVPTFGTKEYRMWRKTREKEMKEGFGLFYKHYHSLWD